MYLSIDFVETAADGQAYFARLPRWVLVTQWTTSLVAIALGVRHALTIGLDWSVVLAFLIPFSHCAPYLLLLPVMAVYLPGFHILIEDESISVECKNRKKTYHKKTYQWTSFVRFGSATEDANYIWLKCGRGDVWIPKRAFLTDTDLTAFRQFVSEKMGDRCKFRIDKRAMAESMEEIVAC